MPSPPVTSPSNAPLPNDPGIFREAALERLASPDELHTLMRVVDARGWLALIGCLALILTALGWGFWGTIPTRVKTSGILIHSGGLADVVAVDSGQITTLLVEVGDQVEQGQVIAHLKQPELAEQILGLKSRLAELQANFQKTERAGGLDANLRKQASARAFENLKSAVMANEQRERELEQRLGEQERAFKEGLITSQELEATREALRTARVSMKTMDAYMERFAVDDFAAERQNESHLMAEKLLIQDTERQIEFMTEKLARSTRVRSTHAGRVVEARTMVGDMIEPGMPLISLERSGGPAALEAQLYVDSREGKRLEPGMEVRIEPSVAEKERHGLLLGKVKSVESYPSTRQGMLRALKNEELVRDFLEESSGTPIAVRATLNRDDKTPSGYAWTSGAGPEMRLTSGTRCIAHVTTGSQRPIALMLPALAR
jgi:HlyD family secretion protein